MATTRIPPSERTSQRIRELLESGGEGDVRSELMRLSMRKLIEEVLEAEVSEAIGRGYYQHAGEDEPDGYRNGYRTGKLASAEGRIEYSAPQVADRSEPFDSKIRPTLSGRTERLEALATEMYARGLSVRDVEDAFRDAGGQAMLSRSSVSRITEVLWAEYEAFATRNLSVYAIAYLFLDGVAERLSPGGRRDAVLCAWGIDLQGKKHLLSLSPGTKEDTDSCKAFIQDMKRRGLGDPLLVATDGAAGLIRSVEECFPRSARQRCLAHKKRNLQSKVKPELWKEFEAEVNACYQAPNLETARMLKEPLVSKWQKVAASAVACFLDDFDACIAQLRFPIGHRVAIRTTNLLERLFEEERRRTKTIPHAFDERAMLKLMFAATWRASQKWRQVKMTAFEQEQLARIREELNEEFNRRHTPAVTPAPSRISSKVGT